jgi:zinc finger protein
MCVTDIPNFKEIVIMSLVCEECGYRSNEIKGGGAIPKYGSKITLRVTCPDDLAREVLKSDTAGVVIPELEMELHEGGLDGVYTTVEGLLNKIRGRLETANPFGCGDSAEKQHLGKDDGGRFSGPSPSQQRFLDFLSKLKDMADGKIFPFTIIISDPLSNSFVGPIPCDALALSLQAAKEGSAKCFDDYLDSAMDVEEYERTEEQKEMLGLNDMKTENYRAATERQPYHGTDQTEALPDRLRHLKGRGPDHPFSVGRAPVDIDTTIIDADSSCLAVPGRTQRGKSNNTLNNDTT